MAFDGWQWRGPASLLPLPFAHEVGHSTRQEARASASEPKRGIADGLARTPRGRGDIRQSCRG